MEAYNAAKKEGIYEKVLLYTGAKVKHYGLNNHKEYFAEATEAYFGVNDFYPFVRAELKETGLKEVAAFVKGIGSGREAAVRALHANGIIVTSIKDVTPIPHNGCRARKPRRV